MPYASADEGSPFQMSRTAFLCLSLIFLFSWKTSGESNSPPLRSRLIIVGEDDFANKEKGLLKIEILDADSAEKGQPVPLPARVIAITSDGEKIDGSGYGLYSDGRFYADGSLTLQVPPGTTMISLSCGPNYIPLEAKLTAKGGKTLSAYALMKNWFSPEERGWFCGDNHIHTRHDPSGDINVDEHYTALQARAEGLDYITEADGQWGFEKALSIPGFLYRAAQEVGTGVFTGHANTPGIQKPLPWEELSRIYGAVLPFQTLSDIVHPLGGAVIYTHTSPVPRLHWMGATESLSDAVLGKCADAFDIANRAEELLWFAILNLGNRVAVSGSTDAVLLRRYTVPPGARRVYAKSGKLDYQAITQAIREGKTFATNGGPLFLFFSIDGYEVGDRIELTSPRSYAARLEIPHLYPLRSVEIIRNGNSFASWTDFAEEETTSIFDFQIEERENACYIARGEDMKGNWAISSPIYISKPNYQRPKASLMAMEIGNFTRMAELRKDFFIHLIITTSHGKLRKVFLLRNGDVIKEFSSEEGDYFPSGRIPVTQPDGEYDEGWIWYPNPSSAVHFQADYPLKEGGWYGVRFETEEGEETRSAEIYFAIDNPNSQQISLLQMDSEKTKLLLRGYGEEMPLEEIKLPFEGDHWWYPQKEFWEVEAIYDGIPHSYKGGYEQAREKFK